MNYCEAMIVVQRENYWGKKTVYTPCGQGPAESHHRLTRARGGTILDKAGETYHLMYLCRKHHQMAEGGDALAGGLLLDGEVTTCTQCLKPKYVGSDQYLDRHYGRAVHLQCVSSSMGGAGLGA